jgi:polysaccharide pyruvyl transferase WcaK-like protein
MITDNEVISSKPKQINVSKIINARNKKFKAAKTNAERRVLIAKDVIEQIKNKLIIAEQGEFVQIKYDPTFTSFISFLLKAYILKMSFCLIQKQSYMRMMLSCCLYPVRRKEPDLPLCLIVFSYQGIFNHR